jgi:hypothetical protein
MNKNVQIERYLQADSNVLFFRSPQTPVSFAREALVVPTSSSREQYQ